MADLRRRLSSLLVGVGLALLILGVVGGKPSSNRRDRPSLARQRRVAEEPETSAESARKARDFTDRVFFNALVILKGVVLAFGASVLLGLIGKGAPWSSGDLLALYLAWFTTLLTATVSFVSQALGTSRSPLHPTTTVIALTFVLGVSEFITFGILAPTPAVADLPEVRPWLLAFAATAATASLFISVVVHQMESSHFPYTTGKNGQLENAKSDRLAAGGTALLSLMLWWLLDLPAVEEHSWAVVSVLVIVMSGALISQQEKADIGGSSA